MLEVGWWGALKDRSKNILKQGWVKAKVVHRGDEGFEGVTNPAPPPPRKKLISQHKNYTERITRVKEII